ncbi:dihydrofolate reductase family protein [Jiangella sp. DSM 45060]|uniref:dihydrofolate reductase family protein n=1 Tax=Jiangella sp. DSM 45060 TaxID=1798224 RepID=UPI00087B7215|nr:dihydrofolate reductase family protein [Jiangella sp. DSM 45060]SDS20764.1 RibD C-terminal domain-containing protein [Jiangella sp. DSM 45060]
MGRIVVTEFSSLDGVVQSPGGGEGFEYEAWSFDFDSGEEGEQFKVDEALGAEALLLGRVTYDGFAAAWPQEEGELADKYNGMRKYVVSSTLTDPTWNNTQVIRGDIATEVAKLKDEVDGELQVAGSIRLAQELFEHDLVDELHLMTYPVLLGRGRRLFGETTDRTRWRLTESRTVGEGVLINLFERVRA